MIESFGNRLAEDLFDDKVNRITRKFRNKLKRTARRKLLYLHDAAELKDLRVPPGNRLEALKGDLSEFHSIRINGQWRVEFNWNSGSPNHVQILDYHNQESYRDQTTQESFSPRGDASRRVPCAYGYEPG